MTEFDAQLYARVRTRAEARCEYCRMAQCLQGARFHVEHIVPRCRGGETTDANLALACPSCNLHKASAVQAADPASALAVRLFHPRLDDWSEHFEVRDARIEGRTAVGRATAELLRFNDPRRVLIRRIEAQLGVSRPSPS